MSSAIPILRPPQTTASTATSNANSPSLAAAVLPSRQLCRNIIIYGTCRFKDKGCVYTHAETGALTPSGSSTTMGTSLLSVANGSANAAVFVPNFNSSNNTPGPASASGSTSAYTSAASQSNGNAISGGAQEFVPRGGAETPALSEDSPFFTPASASIALAAYQASALGKERNAASTSEDASRQMRQYYDQEQNGDYAQEQNGMYEYNNGTNGNSGPNDAYYQEQDQAQYARKPILYHLYHPPTAPSASSSSSGARTSFFLPPALHTSLTLKSEATHATASASPQTNEPKPPDEVGGYTGLVLLDNDHDKRGMMGGELGESGWGGYRSRVYKGWKSDGRCYALRRIEGFRLQHEGAMTVVEKWTRMRHPGIVSVREAFTTRAFGDHSIIFVSDFHPASSTLYDTYLSPASTLPPNPWSSSHLNPNQSRAYRSSSRGPTNPSHPNLSHPNHQSSNDEAGGLSEKILWSYLVQLGSVVKTVHNAGLAMRCLEVNRVIVTGSNNRIRIGGGGVLDVLGWEGAGMNQAGYQQDDLLSLGKVLLSLACGSVSAVHNLPKSVDHLSRAYSPELKNVILYLLSKPSQRKSIEETLAMMGGKVLEELNNSLLAEDTLEGELMKELENGRLVRLLTKFGFINERPEFDHDPRWAETGDRYIIKLFRDFVFHQVDENGRPVTDLSHVLTCLNKLDAGVEEKIMLVSRDEQSCLIVSYREVKNCVESAFTDLSRN